MSYPCDQTDDKWALLEPVFNAPGKRGRKHADDLRTVVDAMIYIARTGCQWRYLPQSFGFAFHDRGGPCGRTKGAKRVVAVDVTGLPVGALVVPASTHENRGSELMLQHLNRQGLTGRLALVLGDRGVTATAARTLGRRHDLEVRRVGWDDKQPTFRPLRHAWRVEVAHGRLGRPRRLAKSFENITTSATHSLRVACIATTLRHLLRTQRDRPMLATAACAASVRPPHGLRT